MVGTTQDAVASRLPLGAFLRRAREEMTDEDGKPLKVKVGVREAARRIEERLKLKRGPDARFSHSQLSRIESGHTVPSAELVSVIGKVYGMSAGEIGALLADAHSAVGGRWFATQYVDWKMQLEALISFEERAARIEQISPMLIPGRFQLPEFTEAIMAKAGLEGWEIEERVAIRQKRAKIHARDHNPVPITALIGEEALHRAPVDDPELMQEQLLELWEWANPARAHVDIRIIPRAAGWYLGIEGGLILVSFGGTQPDIVNIETPTTGLLMQDLADVDAARRGVDTVRKVALSREDSRDLIATVAHQCGMAGSESVA